MKSESLRKKLAQIKVNWLLYVFLLPSLIYIFIFNIMPIYGVQIAFKNFKAGLGIWGSPWTGFDHFIRFVTSYQFGDLMYNTLALTLYGLILGFPIPIILAFLINYTRSKHLSKVAQTATYAPYFISIVVMVSMIQLFLSEAGVVNVIIKSLGFDSIIFMSMPELYRSIYVITDIWQNAGMGSIIYIAALASISPELHEAGIMDGATKFQRIRYIDLPGILPTATILLILRFGTLMNLGFQKAYLLQNDLNLGVSQIISTYVYEIGMLNAEYSYSSAIGLFNNAINIVLLLTVNQIAKKISDVSLW